MSLFKCQHRFEVVERSNALQQDSMGYPLRLCILKCSKCGKLEQQWLDTSEDALNELETCKSFLVKWNFLS